MERLYFYLKPDVMSRVTAGQTSMASRVIAAVRASGWEVILAPDAERPDIPNRDHHHLVVNEAVPSPNCLTLRIAGFDPFWQIERTNDRWDWQVASRPYPHPDIPAERLAGFVTQWRGHVLKGRSPGEGGGILMPLQGKLLRRRSFQSVSPLVMMVETLSHWPDRPVTATLHPAETHDADELESLDTLMREFPNFRVQRGGTDDLLAACDLVVTQNSTVALKGFLLDKPALLWAQIDWHHICASVPRDGQAVALAQAGQKADFARYLFWYCRRQSLFAWEDNAPRIRWRLRELGWPVREPK